MLLFQFFVTDFRSTKKEKKNKSQKKRGKTFAVNAINDNNEVAEISESGCFEASNNKEENKTIGGMKKS